MEFATFADHAAAIEAESADTAIVAAVTRLLRDTDADLPVVARFVQGRVFPAWQSRTLDVGPSNCYEAIARAAGPNVSTADVEERLAEEGDVGSVAASYDLGGQTGLAAFGSGGPDPLTVREVFDELDALAATEGAGSQDAKVDRLFGLFTRCSSEEARYLARLVLAEMRIGVGEGTVRDAIAAAFLAEEESTGDDGPPTDGDDIPPKGDAGDERVVEDLTAFTDAGDGDGDAVTSDEVATADDETSDESATAVDETADDPDAPSVSDEAVDRVERALQVTNDYGEVARVARETGLDGLDELDLQVGRPVQAMLAQAGTVTGALADWDRAAVEWKYDGARVQVHYDGDDVGVYSRNMEDVTDALPELVEFGERHLDVPVILDGEAVAVDDAGDPLPFQEILRRFRRKHDVAQAREDVAVEARFFDCLHADGEDLLDAPLRERHEVLTDLLDAGVTERQVLADPDAVEAVEARALDAGHEGIMLKDPDSTYSPGRRGKHWRKRKPDVETLDLVVTGGEWGEGRRANLVGTFELSVRRGDGDGFATIGNVATGITDEELETLTGRVEPHVREEAGQTIDVEPAVVFEVGYEEIQSSPSTESGYALRFPRFVGVREDKAPRDADSLERVERLVGGG